MDHIQPGDIQTYRIGAGDIQATQIPWEHFLERMRPEIDPWLQLVRDEREQ